MSDSSDSFLRRMFKNYYQELLIILNAISNEQRFKILLTLIDHHSTFSELQIITKLGKTALSHHLRHLLEINFIQKNMRGKYSITNNGKIILDAIGKSYWESNMREEADQNRQIVELLKIELLKEKYEMDKDAVKIIALAPMKVASARSISSSPEHDAWEKIKKWAKKMNLLDDLMNHPVYGFNNPDPEPGKKEYGYEFWIKVDSFMNSEDNDIIIKEFPGGLYAVKRCNLTKEVNSVFFKDKGVLQSWYILHEWVKKSDYMPGIHQYLELSLNPGAENEDLLLDLHFPIKRKEK